MFKNKKFVIIAFLLLIILFMNIIDFNKQEFDGSSIKNDDCYIVDIKSMNGTDSHMMELHEDDILKIHFETFNGSLKLEIKDASNNSIYTGNGKEPTEFTINILESGIYTFNLKANHAKGYLNIQLN